MDYGIKLGRLLFEDTDNDPPPPLPGDKEFLDSLSDMAAEQGRKHKMLSAVEKRLQHIATGTTRAVYDIGGDYVLKVPRSTAQWQHGTAQNRSEVELFRCSGKDYLAEITDYDKKNYSWLVMEKVIVDEDALSNSIAKVFDTDGLTDNGELSSDRAFFIAVSGNRWDTLRKHTKPEHKQWIAGFQDVATLCNAPMEDMHSGNVGVRPSTGMPVIVDYANYAVRTEAMSVGGGGIVGFIGPVVGKKKKRRVHETTEQQWFYHGTNMEGLWGIQDTGYLNVFRPSHGTPDQDVWPDGATEKRAYLSAAERGVEPFYPEEGPYVLLRVKHNPAFKRESGTGDWYTTKRVPVSMIDYRDDTGNWHPAAAI